MPYRHKTGTAREALNAAFIISPISTVSLKRKKRLYPQRFQGKPFRHQNIYTGNETDPDQAY
jgi:hypothetical protein